MRVPVRVLTGVAIRVAPARGLGLALLAAGAFFGSWPAGPAEAGTYSARLCFNGIPVSGHAGPFQRVPGAKFNLVDCTGSDPLTVWPEPNATIQRGAGAEWSLDIPSEITIQTIDLRARGRTGNGFDPRVLGTRPGVSSPILLNRDELTSEFAQHSFTGEFEHLGIALVCAEETCNTSSEPSANVALRGVEMSIVDPTPPTLEVNGGTLFDGAVQRDVQQVDLVASDGGSGIWQAFARVNGRELPPLPGSCTLAEGFAARLPACERAFAAPLHLDTRGPPWRQGVNRVEICVRDYAASGANEVCTPSRRLRVENGCAVNATYPTDLGRELELRFAHGGRSSLTTAQAQRPRMNVTLRDATGAALAGARVCVYEQRAGSRSERLVSQAETDSSGIAALELGAGASRKLRATYWFGGAEGVLTDSARLAVRPRVGLALSPGGTLRNGDRMRLAAKLAGPYRKGRRVCFWVQQPRRPVRLGCAFTDRRGIAHRFHRFTQVTGRRATFRFYATVPRQRGYPYAAGKSKLQRKTVRG